MVSTNKDPDPGHLKTAVPAVPENQTVQKQMAEDQTPQLEQERERLVLERILGLKQVIKDGLGGPVELHELGICYFTQRNYRKTSQNLAEIIQQNGD